MWLSPVTTVAPTAEPLPLSAALSFLRVSPGADDASISQLIADAREHVEEITGTRLISQTVTLKANNFGDLARLPIAPVSAVASMTYQDTQGQPQTLAPSDYELFGARYSFGVRPALGKSWPATRSAADAITVTVTAGYGPTGASVPGPVKRAMLLLIGDWYELRSDTVAERGVNPQTTPNGVLSLLTNYRR